MKTQEEIEQYMQLHDWHITVVSPAEQEIIPNRDEHTVSYDPEYDSVYIFDEVLYFTVAPEVSDVIYQIGGQHFQDTEDFLCALEEAFTLADFPKEEAAMHAVFREFQEKFPYKQ